MKVHLNLEFREIIVNKILVSILIKTIYHGKNHLTGTPMFPVEVFQAKKK